MKKISIFIVILLTLSTSCFAMEPETKMKLYCHHSGIDGCKYEILMKKFMIMNNLQLNEEQKKGMADLFETYGTELATIVYNIKQEKLQMQPLKESKCSLRLKYKHNSKLKKLQRDYNRVDKKLDSETKKILTPEQRYKYKILKDSLFK